MRIKFNDSDKIYNITSFRQISGNLIIMKGADLPAENTSGFQSVQDDGTVLKDYSDFTTKYNVITPSDGVMMLSNSAKYVETEDNPASHYCYTPSEEVIQAMLQEAKENKISQSKTELAEYLANNPIASSAHGGKEGIYSVTQEKQSLMMSQYMTYQIEKTLNPDAKLTWNESGEECEEWTEEEFLQLILEVRQRVYPLVSYQQSIEKAIRACTTDEELDAIVIDYSQFAEGGGEG